MSTTAIVVGGGIGGLAVAAGLARTDWDVTVYEKAPQLRALGAGITLAPNAVRALDWLGLGDDLRARGMAQGTAGLRTASGRWLMRSRVDELEARYGVPTFALHRSDLHRMLARAAGRARVLTGHEVTSVQNAGTHAAVSFNGPDGPWQAGADVVVVADGVHSRLRRQLFPEHPGPAYGGYVTWRGVVPADAAPHDLDSAVTESWGRGRRFGYLPLAGGAVYWFGGDAVPEGAHRDDTLAQVAARFAGWHSPIPQLLTATPPDGLLRHDIYHLATPLPSYTTGRIALLGDAAHAMTPDLGQGAAQALEDAVTLAVTLGQPGNDDTLAAGLARYDRLRRPRTQELVRASYNTGRLARGRTLLGAAARNALARLIPESAYLRLTTETFAWRPPHDVSEPTPRT